MANSADPIETMPVSPYGRLTRRVLRLLAAVVLAFLYLPIVFMIALSFNDSRIVGLPWAGFTFDWYTVAVATAVAILATIIGSMAAFVLVRGRIRYPGATRVVATMPIMFPGMLLGIGILIFLRRVLDLDLSLYTVTAGHLVFTVPFVILIVAARLQGFDRNLEWAAADLGATPRLIIRHIILPLIWPAVLAAALISVTLSVDEFIITFFTVGNESTLPLYIYTQIKFGVTPEVNAIATMFLAVMLGLLVVGTIVVAVYRRFKERRRA